MAELLSQIQSVIDAKYNGEKRRVLHKGLCMKSPMERDKEMLDGLSKAVTFAKPSFIRLVFFTALGLLVGLYGQSLQSGYTKALLAISDTILLVALFESSRFGYYAYQRLGGWVSFAIIVVAFFLTNGLYEFCEFMGWLPLNTTAGWTLFIWIGFVIGVCLAFLDAPDRPE